MLYIVNSNLTIRGCCSGIRIHSVASLSSDIDYKCTFIDLFVWYIYTQVMFRGLLTQLSVSVLFILKGPPEDEILLSGWTKQLAAECRFTICEENYPDVSTQPQSLMHTALLNRLRVSMVWYFFNWRARSLTLSLYILGGHRRKWCS